MATIREYFDTDFAASSAVHSDWTMSNSLNDSTLTVRAKIIQDLDANAKFWTFYIDDKLDLGFLTTISSLLNFHLIQECILSEGGDKTVIQSSFGGYSEWCSSKTLVFTKRVFLYVNQLTTPELRKQASDIGLQKGLHVITRDNEYAALRAEHEKPMAFISHDSRDKDDLVRQLSIEMQLLSCPVWYDEYSMKLGDSLRSSIEKGLKECRKCILVLSPNFISNDGWGKAEFDSIYTREIIERNNVILPVWHNVDVKDVYEYSPRLADKLAIKSNVGVKELAKQLAAAIK